MTRLFKIDHLTRFGYTDPIRESVVELRMQPRTEGRQSLRAFDLSISPHSQLFAYTDFLGNTVYTFDVPGQHQELEIRARSLVEVSAADPLPDALPADSWQGLDRLASSADNWEMTQPSTFAEASDLLDGFEADLELGDDPDPLTKLRRLNDAVYAAFDYVPESTRADSPIDEALTQRRGVCQDFAHIMITIVRRWGVPARYVSGYILPGDGATDRSSPDASHAWVEACLPEIGWVGLDPTNDTVAGERHVRVAVGRDYADVPPTRGLFKGDADSDLSVAVTVEPVDGSIRHEEFMRSARPVRRRPSAPPAPPPPEVELQQQQQQQQQ